MKSVILIASFLSITAILSAAEPAALEQALVSNPWKIQIDSRPPMEVHFSSDGTAKGGKALWHWMATGPQTFTINGNNSCIFNQTFDKFMGHWTNQKGDHTMTAVQLSPGSETPTDSAPAPAQPLASPNSTPFDNPLDKPAYDQRYIWTSGNYYYLGRPYGWRYWYQGRYYYSNTAPGAAANAARGQQTAAANSTPANPLDRPAYDQHYIWTSGSYYYLGHYYPWRYSYQGRYYYSATPPAAAQAQQSAAPASTPSNPLDRPAY